MQDYRHLRVWQLATETAVDVYQLTNTFPRHEIYGLTQQMRRASISIASNIAEGAGRDTRADFKRFCSIALGSAHELECQAEIAIRLGYAPRSNSVVGASASLIRMLSALLKTLEA